MGPEIFSTICRMVNKFKRKSTIQQKVIFGVAFILIVTYLGGSFSLYLQSKAIGPNSPTFSPIYILSNIIEGFTGGINNTFFIVAACGILLYFVMDKGKLDKFEDSRGFRRSENGTYGTAKLMDYEEASEVYSLKDFDKDHTEELNSIYGYFEEEQQTVSIIKEPQFEGDTRHYNTGPHTVVLGASGSRKSRSWALPEIFKAIRNKRSMVVVDPKGSLLKKVGWLILKSGMNLKSLNLVKMGMSDRWNVVKDVFSDIEEEEIEIRAQIFCKVIIDNTSEGGRPDVFFDNAEMALLKAITLYVVKADESSNIEKTLGSIYNHLLINLGKPGDQSDDTLYGLFFNVKVSDPKHPALKSWEVFKQASPNAQGNVALGLANRLQVLQPDIVQELLSDDLETRITPEGYEEIIDHGIKILDLAKEPTILFLVIPDQHSTYQFIVSLIFSFLFEKLVPFADEQPNEKLPIPMDFLMDEFANIGCIPDFEKKISTVRSRDISISIILQSKEQLSLNYFRKENTIISNCDNILFLGGQDDVTSKFMSELSGKMTINVSTSAIQERAIGMRRSNNDYRKNESEGRRMVFEIDEIKKLNPDHCLFFSRGHDLLEITKFDYTLHELAKEIEEDNPYLHISHWKKEKIAEKDRQHAAENIKNYYQDLLEKDNTPDIDVEDDKSIQGQEFVYKNDILNNSQKQNIVNNYNEQPKIVVSGRKRKPLSNLFPTQKAPQESITKTKPIPKESVVTPKKDKGEDNSSLFDGSAASVHDISEQSESKKSFNSFLDDLS